MSGRGPKARGPLYKVGLGSETAILGPSVKGVATHFELGGQVSMKRGLF